MAHFDLFSSKEKLGVYRESRVAEMNQAVGVICMQIFDRSEIKWDS